MRGGNLGRIMGKRQQNRGQERKQKKYQTRRRAQATSIAKWAVLFSALILAMAGAIYLNSLKDEQSSSKLELPLDTSDTEPSINWSNYPTENIILQDSLEITRSGSYRLTGTLEDGIIDINIPHGQVKLILDGVTINHSSGPVILCRDAETLVIELVGVNTIEDGHTYLTDYGDEINGTIYSEADLYFQGDGELDITANYLDGIVGKKSIVFNGGTYKIKAEDDGIRGKDSVRIADGNYIINASADAIKATNDQEVGEGYIQIENGDFDINSGNKGIKSANTIIIHGGEFSIKSHDDAIHSDSLIGITGGIISINAGDDAIHANRRLIVDGGKIVVARAKEGLEAQAITINDGFLRIIAIDDGINASGGDETDEKKNTVFNETEELNLSINGGYIYVDAAGDGLDSNGWININGGKIIIDGPTNDKNGALDATMGMIIHGGEVVAVGSSKMAQEFDLASSIYSTSIYLDSVYPAGTKFEIRSQAGDTIMELTTKKTCDYIIIASPNLIFGEKYALYIDDEFHQDFIILGNGRAAQGLLETTTTF